MCGDPVLVVGPTWTSQATRSCIMITWISSHTDYDFALPIIGIVAVIDKFLHHSATYGNWK